MDETLHWGQPKDGWHFTKNYGQYQKCAGRITVYVERQLFQYRANLYLRGDLTFCKLEARVVSDRNLHKLFDLADSWMEAYVDGDMERIRQDLYSIDNPAGVWGVGVGVKKYYID